MRTRTKTRRPLSILAAALLLIALTACSSAEDVSGTAEPGAPAPDEEVTQDDSDHDFADDVDGAEREVGFAPGEFDRALPAARPARRTGERVIKEGTLSLEIAEGGYARAFQQVVTTARTLGGDVVASSASTDDDGVTSGSITVRVPVERYEDLLGRVGDLGTLRDQQITAQDVSAEYVDLESRLRHLRAQEGFYLGLLKQADGVSDAIAVQQQLDGLQLQIEQAQGRLNHLEDRTSFSTLTVELLEPGTHPVLATAQHTTLADYWASAQAAFVTVVGWLLVGTVALAPLLLPLLAAFGLWRLSHRRQGGAGTLATRVE